MQRCASKNGGKGQCENEVIAKGLCQGHYRKQWRLERGEGKKSGDSSLRDKDQKLVRLHQTNVEPEIAFAVQEHAFLLGISNYEMERRIYQYWFKHRQEALTDIRTMGEENVGA